ncbi:MAG: ATP-binding protein [Planctomycetes bacterium]|nr:ATP-binding protein [Planctomycetota bacterium]
MASVSSSSNPAGLPAAPAAGAPGDRRPGRFPLTIGRKLGLAFALLAALLFAIGLAVSVRVAGMGTDIARMLEEHREATLSRELVRSIQFLESHLQLRGGGSAAPGDPSLEIFGELLATAEGSLEQLRRGPGGEDPSEATHVERENRLFALLTDSLAGVRAGLARAPRGEDAAPAVGRARLLAEEVYGEMEREARESARHLRAQGGELRRFVLGTTLVGLLALGAVLLVVARRIVLPLRTLHHGAGRIRRGDLAHRVSVSSRDEVGELAREFNDMAGRLEEARADLERRVEERTREFLRAARLAGLGTLAAGVAHEINNPLASIASCAEGLEERLRRGTASAEEGREYLRLIAKEAYRAREITGRLLDFARPGPAERAPFDPAGVLQEVRLLVEPPLRSRGLSLLVDCDPDLPLVLGDPAECKQVAWNLLQNAIDASPTGGTIRVRCRRRKGEILLEVEDEGPGIPPQHLDRIFDPFFTTKAPGEGTGLGLAIVHRIVEGHGGRIEVRNTERGALFRVFVPSIEAAA